ncbi:MAG TPA: response regulator transcription factor [Anaerolineaceae bacterium]|nr:response regulator transcription factor [Anaerolineaceae bacterium]
MSKNILLVDDDALLRRSLAFRLEKAGYHASTAANAEEAIKQAGANPPDLVLLDIGLPGMDGLDAMRRFHNDIHIPVIFLTARDRELDEVLGLELGADDYVTKPFELDVLLARIKTVLRRAVSANPSATKPAPIKIGKLCIDPVAHTVTMNEQELELARLEFGLLYTLASEAGQVISVDDLLARVWGAEFVGEPQVIYVYIRLLREKLEEDPNHPRRIINVHGVGYKLVKEQFE